MIRRILIGVAIVVVAVLGYAATRPDSFHVERSIAIAAPASVPHALIDDFHAWPQWSPYEKLDPTMQRQYDGAARGVGAGYGWSGDGQAGAGHMTILESAADRIVIRLDFSKPFTTRNTVTFSLQPDDAGTRVSWAMDGPSPYISKLMGLFFDMDKMIGRDFESGLASLKARAETATAAP